MSAKKNAIGRPNVAAILRHLKDFQRDTVEYVFRRLYDDDDRVSRFLVADEVGLGKTMVARGVIAKAVDKLWDTVERIDVIYICSNLEIAQQNIDRLNISANGVQLATRATLLPVQLNQLAEKKLNFISLTPGTSFSMHSSTGVAHERVLLYHLLRKTLNVSELALSNTFRVGVTKENWEKWLSWFAAYQAKQVDRELKRNFLTAFEKQPELRKRFENLVRELGGRRVRIPSEMNAERYRLINEVRALLAQSSLAALEPDLIILDEFQRFKHLLAQDDPLSSLARKLFDYKDAKVLMLSATPYKMYTLQGETGEDHYEDFLRTADFLLDGLPGKSEELEQAIENYRQGIFHIALPENCNRLQKAQAEIESILRKVMVRTERLAATEDRNGMLSQPEFAASQVKPGDLQAFMYLDQIAQAIQAGDQVEYWKSSAYPLNLMDAYTIKRRLRQALEDRGKNGEVIAWLRSTKPFLLNWEAIMKYEPVDFGNARLRTLVSETLDTGNWRLLWMPTAFPYDQPSGAYINLLPNGQTKTLIFSSWQIVPKTIAVLLSYEAERRIVDVRANEYPYDQLTQKRSPLLRFAESQGRLTGMSNFCLLYPCLTLANSIDPLRIAQELSQNGQLPTAEQILAVIETHIAKLLRKAVKDIPGKTSPSGSDESWYWYSLLLLDRTFHERTVHSWLDAPGDDGNLSWVQMLDQNQEAEHAQDGPSRFAEHVMTAKQFLQQPEALGPQPKDLVHTLAVMALASPAVCTLRSLLRRTNCTATISHLAAAAQAGMGFRTLLNQPETILLLQDQIPGTDYWKAVLEYAIQGNLQAVMDEYVHILYESLGLMEHTAQDSALKIGKKIRESLDVRAPLLRFDEFIEDTATQGLKTEIRRIRCRYALRIGDDVSEEVQERTRAASVREAFNSPFRPFVLASTSIGQEGLDFHPYCHRIVHWNLPSNPVDLEQREGRIHRYKGHVIRRNLAQGYTLQDIPFDGKTWVDPWEFMFQNARKNAHGNDMVPFWIYPGDYTIERLVPLLPLSREHEQLSHLKQALVAYRSVIGQPRQQDLLEFLTYLPADERKTIVNEFKIDLSPPRNAQSVETQE